MDGLSEGTVFLSLSYEVKGPGQRKMNRKTDVCFTVSRHLFKQAKNFRKLVVSHVGEMKVSAEQMRLPIMTDPFFFNKTDVRQCRQVFFYDNHQRRETVFSYNGRVGWEGRFSWVREVPF